MYVLDKEDHQVLQKALRESIDIIAQAAKASNELQEMYAQQEAYSKLGSVPSWPRDKFEAWVDGLTEDARKFLVENNCNSRVQWKTDILCKYAQFTGEGQ